MIFKKTDDIEILRSDSEIVFTHRKSRFVSIFLLLGISVFSYYGLGESLKWTSPFDIFFSVVISALIAFAIYSTLHYSFNSTELKIDSKFAKIRQTPFPTRPTIEILKTKIKEVQIKIEHDSESPDEFYNIVFQLEPSEEVLVFQDLNFREEAETVRMKIIESLQDLGSSLDRNPN
ncbi:hypothetical protein [Leptospira adleri]|uniref:Uncharacterized protein n=1 Tax=Leptospira adleri TaxID=2023186 RepID=A0A2M9YMF9_9LEPT|nr:hypothetical protein [Leptospira adleri]PJZ52735.1 hypothetical protein CH380_13345 [Leptospira adleri]PJZ61755.1 hypothetical protein CH376_11625 [Leptospira adleri]